MSIKEDDQPYDPQAMEKWLENYFLDPLTTYLDQMQFRIDLYETDKDWIVEALLNDYESYEITVFVEDKKLIIKAAKPPILHMRTRIITFPFTIANQKITAVFQTGILEVSISKIDKEPGKDRFITLP